MPFHALGGKNTTVQLHSASAIASSKSGVTSLTETCLGAILACEVGNQGEHATD
jgi:hypothetical protein